MKVKLGDYVLMVQEREVLKKVDTSKYVSTENILADRNGVKFPANTIPLSKTITTYKKDDILISNIRPYFKKIWKAEFDGPKSNDVIAFRTKDSRLLQDYLYVVLQSDNFFNYVTNTAKGTKMPRGDKKAIINYEFELPNIQLQRKISHTILVLEKKIRLNNQINDNLVELINLIYLKFCADFPAKEKVSLDDVFNTSTKTFNVNENKNINIWHFSIPNFDCNKQPQCESTNSIKSNKKKVNSFGVLVSKLNPNFKRIWAPNLDFYSNYSPIASPEFIQINGNSQEEQALIFCILNSEEYTDFLVSNTTGSTNSRQRVKPKIAVSYIIPFDLDKKKGLESLVSPILKEIQQREFENTKLQIIKDTVLNKYF